MTTREEYLNTVYDLRHAAPGLYDEDTVMANASIRVCTSAENALVAAYDALAARIQAADAEVAEFNAGFDAYGAGVPVENEPSDTAHDVWRVGWAWAAFPYLVKRVAELEASR